MTLPVSRLRRTLPTVLFGLRAYPVRPLVGVRTVLPRDEKPDEPGVRETLLLLECVVDDEDGCRPLEELRPE